MARERFDVVILGAGAAGLLCAYFSSLKGKKVLVIDHNDKVGKKILISGGGRCNFTNPHSNAQDFYSENPHFCKSALAKFPPSEFIKLVDKANIKYHEKKLGQLFCDRSAKEIIELLLSLIKSHNVSLRLNQKDIEVEKIESLWSVRSDSMQVEAIDLVIATGGLSIPTIGATGLGHKIAKKYGHKIIVPTPALVPFLCADFQDLSGISLLAKVQYKKHAITEEVLFTHKGLSGPAILKISLYWQSSGQLQIDWLPENDFIKIIQADQSKGKLEKLMNSIFPSRFSEFLLAKAQIDGKKHLLEISRKQLQQLEELIHQYKLIPDGTEGFRKAEVTRGGVDTSEISSQNMQSKLCPNLFFIGEVLDVTGQLGGHNFQWAWSSAFAAGDFLKD